MLAKIIATNLLPRTAVFTALPDGHVLKLSLPSSASRMRTSRTTNPKVLLFTGIDYVIVLSTAFEYLLELWRLPLSSLISQAHLT